MTEVTVVLVAHSRPIALRTLGRSLSGADVADGTNLVISIDGGASSQGEVEAVAETLAWPFGSKDIIEHDRVGLVEHFFHCGDLTANLGNVVLLEDDLVVASSFARWGASALAHAERDDRIAGVSLATPWFDGYRQLPFEPVIDGSDGVYAQVPWYDGMAWTPAMWQRFRDWTPDSSVPLHTSLDTLDADEWFPDAMRYLVANDRFFLMPREAQATNTGAAGVHFEERTDFFQAPISLGGPREFDLIALDDALAVYDDHMELTESALRRIVGDLPSEAITVDLLGVRDLDEVATPLVLTTRRVDDPIRTWAASMHPLVANLAFDMPGTAIRLAALSDVDRGPASDSVSLSTLRLHAARGRTPSTKDRLRSVASDVTRKLRRD